MEKFTLVRSKFMTKVGLTLSVLGILVGIGIFGITLLVAAQVSSHGQGDLQSQRRLYFDDEIKPDHLLYPLVAGADRLKLALASQDEKVVLQIAYAERRFEHARQLLEAGQEELAVATFTKSQQYLFLAASGLEECQRSRELNADLLARLQIQTYMLEQYKDDFIGTQDKIDKLIGESQVMISCQSF